MALSNPMVLLVESLAAATLREALPQEGQAMGWSLKWTSDRIHDRRKRENPRPFCEDDPRLRWELKPE
ncbi:MAG: hypothetical protein ACE5IO_08185 [Thermoplasmata archaeon]